MPVLHRLTAPLCVSLLAFAALSACQVEPEAAGGPQTVMLTVLAEDAPDSAPALGLFSRYALSGPARGFTAADLTTLGAVEIRADYPAGEAVRTWSGPRLSAVLTAAGAPGAGARLTAADGYQVEIEAALIAAHEPILALSVEGAPLTLGGLGPVILIWPRADDPALSETGDDLWAWGVFAVEALDE